ncbi:glycoside hydrolase family 30 protein [Proteiniclasticum sp. SCR006]|uniref:Glycoside hydrolase family 30 protein n=1 Tax=Proteiniclasticum aestuarii TaxID=2817862 RepID=A0A939HA10_9CLOT|nr:glycoside hydrolase family 30 protein [Proteiniclasticum aestuarii]MBO1265926.1 glycoside hydrolase family 30 protein [Proteiniclasticum aestuarii]
MKVKAIRSEKRDLKFWKTLPERETGHYDPKRPVIAVNSRVEYQEFMGFGGAFTESAAFTLSEAPETVREEALRAYFSKLEGLGYVLGRVHINSSDFSLENYTYVEEGDQDLSTFDLSREDRWVVPMIRDAMRHAEEPLKLLASPWSPPGYMKDTGEMNYGGKLLPQFADIWAKYYARYIEEMKKRGIGIWAVSVQNEPLATQTWDSCIYTAEEERDFVKHHLGPVISATHPDTKIIVWDHNRDVLVERGAVVLSDLEAAQYVWGVGNHWYVSEAFENLTALHNMFPDKHILFTEGCVELTTTSENAVHNGYLGSWSNGERYGRNIMGDFNNWSRGWIDWNLVLNEIGGPNHVYNYCEAPIMYDRNTEKLIYNNSYYYIGHFSKYIAVGARRLEISVTKEDVHAVAFRNPDGRIVVVAQNEGFIAELSLVVDGEGLNINLPDNSITTFIIG